KAFALKILRGAHGSREYAPGLSFFSSGGLDPGDRHHGAVDGPRHGLIGGLHPLQHLAQNQRLNTLRQRQTHAIDIGGSPDVAIFNSSKNRMLFAFRSNDSTRALLAGLAMMADPGLAQHLSTETTFPFFAVPRIASIGRAFFEGEGMRRRSHANNGPARFDVIDDVLHLVVRQFSKPSEDDH